jgi:hypothetical protein
MPLTSEQRSELNNALGDAFDLSTLTAVLRDRLEKRLDKIVHTAASFTQVVYDLTIQAEREGWSESLISAAHLQNPGNEQLRAFCEKHAPYAFLIEPLSKGFTGAELQTFLRTELNPELDQVTSSTDLTRIAFDLVTTAEKGGWGKKLLEAVNKAKPDNASLRDFYNRYAPFYSARAARTGLFELAGQVSNPQVRSTVDRFQGHFRAARANIQVLAAYKALHDRLHNLQVEYYDRFLRNASLFLTDVAAFGELEDDEIALVPIPQKLRRLAEAVSTRQVEEAWIQRLEQAITYLHTALATHTEPPLRHCIDLLKSLLRFQPPRINGLMVAAAGELPLRELIAAMRSIAPNGGAPTTGFEDDAATRLRGGLQGLLDLQPRLARLVEEHNQWQQTDNDLVLATSEANPTVASLEFLWQDNIKPAVLRLCGGSSEPWANALGRSVAQVETDFGTKDLDAIRSSLARLRHRATLRFHEVDDNLNQLCNQLLVIGGEPLDSILRAVAHANNP